MSEIDLYKLRELIDEIDEGIVDLYKRRIDICKSIAEYKLRNGLAIYDADRENMKLESLSAKEQDTTYRKAILDLYKYIMEYSKKYQDECIVSDKR